MNPSHKSHPGKLQIGPATAKKRRRIISPMPVSGPRPRLIIESANRRRTWEVGTAELVGSFPVVAQAIDVDDHSVVYAGSWQRIHKSAGCRPDLARNEPKTYRSLCASYYYRPMEFRHALYLPYAELIP